MPEPYIQSLRLRDMAVNERPQERLESMGPKSLSDTELLAMLLRSGSARMDVLTLAGCLISDAGSLSGLLQWSVDDFRKLPGIGHVKALQLITVIEIARRILIQGGGEKPVLDSPDKIQTYMQPVCQGMTVEKFWILCLNTKHRLIRRIEITSGIANSSLVHPREVFREAIRNAATSIVCVHNHPSGDPAPSSADLQATRKLRNSAETIGIDLLDHVIVGDVSADPLGRGYYSFSESGLL